MIVWLQSYRELQRATVDPKTKDRAIAYRSTYLLNTESSPIVRSIFQFRYIFPKILATSVKSE